LSHIEQIAFARLMAGIGDSADRAQIIRVGASLEQQWNGKFRQPVGLASAACATAEGARQRMMHRGG
jgi:hypothetical protein